MSIARFTFNQQWGHVGSEIGRAIGRRSIGDDVSYKRSIERALGMLDEMVEVHRGVHNLKETLRFREFLAGHYVGENDVVISLEELETFCNQFAFAMYN